MKIESQIESMMTDTAWSCFDCRYFIRRRFAARREN
jgi:hypothetical protein